VAWFLIEVGLIIKYRYFELFSNLLNYLYAVIFGIVMIESIYRVWSWIDRHQYRESSPGRRFFLQILTGI